MTSLGGGLVKQTAVHSGRAGAAHPRSDAPRFIVIELSCARLRGDFAGVTAPGHLLRIDSYAFVLHADFFLSGTA